MKTRQQTFIVTITTYDDRPIIQEGLLRNSVFLGFNQLAGVAVTDTTPKPPLQAGDRVVADPKYGTDAGTVLATSGDWAWVDWDNYDKAETWKLVELVRA